MQLGIFQQRIPEKELEGGNLKQRRSNAVVKTSNAVTHP
jgi:hypothetical protein